MVNNNTFTLDSGGGSSCTQDDITGKELSHDSFCLHYWHTLTRTLLSDLTVCVAGCYWYCNSQFSLMHESNKMSAQRKNAMSILGITYGLLNHAIQSGHAICSAC